MMAHFLWRWILGPTLSLVFDVAVGTVYGLAVAAAVLYVASLLGVTLATI